MSFKYNPQHHIIKKLKFGKQGIVGIIYDKSSKETRLYKFSSQMNMLGTHEYKIMKSIDSMNKFCPFFTKCYELVNLQVNENFEHVDNPFEIGQKDNKFILDVCISEFINKSRKFTTFIHHAEQVNDNIVISILKQVLLASILAKNKFGLTHYDLHSENILVQKCSYNDVYVWHDKKNDTTYVIPTLGYIPRIIDYGFSYSSELNKTSITTPLDFMREGYISIRTDEFADFRILLISMLEDLYHYRQDSELFTRLKRIVKKLFKRLNLDWESGWFIDNKSGANKFLYESILKDSKAKKYFSSPTVDEHFFSILGLLQTLIDNPLNFDPLPDKTMSELYDEFLFGFNEFFKHFVKLEHAFEKNTNYKNEKEYESNPKMGLYIIRCTIDCILQTRDTYLNSDKSKDAVRKFQNMLFDSIRINKKMFDPKINYEKYMVSIYVMTNSYHSLLYKESVYRKKYIDNQYKYTPVTTCNDIYYILNQYLQVPYHYTVDSRIIFINDDTSQSEIYKLNEEQCFSLNNTDTIQANKLMHIYISDMKPIFETSDTNTIQNILSENSNCESPENKVGMNSWSDSDSEDEFDSDLEDFEIKYNWTIDDNSNNIYELNKYTDIHNFVLNSSSSESEWVSETDSE